MWINKNIKICFFLVENDRLNSLYYEIISRNNLIIFYFVLLYESW